MSREAWGDPPEQEPQRCPVCDGEWHAEGCELGEEVSRRLKAEAEVETLLSNARVDAMRMGKLAEDVERYSALHGRLFVEKTALGIRCEELLEALFEITEHLERIGDTRPHKDGEYIDAACAAIARATGEPHDPR